MGLNIDDRTRKKLRVIPLVTKGAMFRIPLPVSQKLGVELLVDLSKPGEILVGTAGSEAHPRQYLQGSTNLLRLTTYGCISHYFSYFSFREMKITLRLIL